VIVVVAAVIETNERFLVTRRQAGVHLAGLWEFPGGKIDPDESHAAALKRELKEELDAEIEVADCLYTTVHAYDDRTVDTARGAADPGVSASGQRAD
jgi:8-oxo-dGTP diphosphatase